MTKVSINKAIQELSISKSNLYSKLKKLEIKSMKIGNRAYLLDSDIASIKQLISKKINTVQTEKRQIVKAELIEKLPMSLEKHYEEHYNDQIEALKQQYSRQILGLKKELKQTQVENQQLILECGKWQGIAQILEEQNSKILARINTDKKSQTKASVKKEKESLFKKSVTYFNENF